MTKFARVGIQWAYENRVPNGEKQGFRNGDQDGIVYKQGFRSGVECKRIEFEFRHVYRARTSLLSAELWADMFGFGRFVWPTGRRRKIWNSTFNRQSCLLGRSSAGR